MKTKILKFSLFTAILGVVLWSCKKDKDSPNNLNSAVDPSALTINEFDYIGQKHNEGLDYVYDKLLELKSENAKIYTKEEIMELANSYTVDYYEIIKNSDSFENAEEIINNSFYNMHTQDKLYNTNLELSDGLTQLLDNLDLVLKNQSLTKEEIIINIKELEQIAHINLSLEDKRIFFSASTVGRYTMEYWSNNITKWKTLLNTQTESWYGDAGGADVAGAVGGAAGAWVVNVVPVAGQVTYGGAIIGAAVAGSVGSAVYSLWGWLTS